MIDWKAEVPSHLFNSFYINGTWVKGSLEDVKDITSPATGKVIFAAPMAEPSDMDAAITAAKQAFDSGTWRDMPPQKRSIFIHRLADRLVRTSIVSAKIWTAQVGAPISLTSRLAPLAIVRLRYFADLAASFPFETDRPTRLGHAKVIQEPIGPAALIIPWNAALPILMTKLGAALAAGCTCIIKSSPESPLDAMLVAQCAHEIGLPPGVINVLLADASVSSQLVASYDVPKVSFTGSVQTGAAIASTVASRMGRITLELGGKPAAIMLEDADVEKAMSTLQQFSMPFSGQFCFSQSRLLVPRSREAEYTEAFVKSISDLRVGNPWDDDTQIGPVLNERQFNRIMTFIEDSVVEGAEVLCGGKPDARHKGNYILPTVVRRVSSRSRIASEEIFGPVVTVHTYDTIDEAVEIANSTDFGLSGTVFGSPEAAVSMARRLRTGKLVSTA